jgi:hypothetical protein
MIAEKRNLFFSFLSLLRQTWHQQQPQQFMASSAMLMQSEQAGAFALQAFVKLLHTEAQWCLTLPWAAG